MLSGGPPKSFQHGKMMKQSFIIKVGIGIVLWLFPGPRIGLAMLAVTGLELSVLALHPSGFWWNGGLSWLCLVSLVALIVLWWGMIAWLGFWCVKGARTLGARMPSNRVRTAIVITAVVLLALGQNFYLAC